MTPNGVSSRASFLGITANLLKCWTDLDGTLTAVPPWLKLLDVGKYPLSQAGQYGAMRRLIGACAYLPRRRTDIILCLREHGWSAPTQKLVRDADEALRRIPALPWTLPDRPRNYRGRYQPVTVRAGLAMPWSVGAPAWASLLSNAVMSTLRRGAPGELVDTLSLDAALVVRMAYLRNLQDALHAAVDLGCSREAIFDLCGLHGNTTRMFAQLAAYEATEGLEQLGAVTPRADGSWP